MTVNRFQINTIIRLLLICGNIFLFFYVYQHYAYIVTSGAIFILIIVQVFLLFKYLDRTNREIARFFNSIKFSDFSQSFASHYSDPSFRELSESILGMMNKFQQERSEKEESYQYLQTVVKHIRTGLIAYNNNGDIELINNAAQKLLEVNSIKHLQSLEAVSADLVKVLRRIKSGDKELIKCNAGGKLKQLSIYAAEFKMKNKKLTLISLQDITNELERERMANELEIAHEVQMKLLPKSKPHIRGYALDAGCLPAKEVGGDYYDFTNLSGGRTGIVIADVAGKGLPAAFYMTLTKGVFQAFADSGISPKETLIKINNLLCSVIEKGSFVTMFYGILDPAENSFTFVRGGHEPVIHFNSSMNPEILRPAGLGLGLDNGDIFRNSIEEKTISLQKGDYLVFYTDGFTDVMNGNNQQYGSSNLINLIEQNRRINPGNLLLRLFDEVKNFRNDTEQYDDMTMVLLKREE